MSDAEERAALQRAVPAAPESPPLCFAAARKLIDKPRGAGSDGCRLPRLHDRVRLGAWAGRAFAFSASTLLRVGLGLLVVCMMRGGWWEACLATALLFAVPCLYLLIPTR